MRFLGWFSFFLLIVLLFIGGYIYKYQWLPMKRAVLELQEENKGLLKLLKEKGETASPTQKQKSSEIENLLGKRKLEEGLKLELNVLDLFPKGKTSLKESGKKVIENFYNSIKKLSYDTIEVLIHRDPKGARKKLSARRALAIKYYFIKLGVDKRRVWAWVRKEIPQGKVVLRVIRHD